MNQTPDTATKPVTCPNCGHDNIPGAAFCSRCGISLRGDTPVESSASEPPDDTETTTTYRPIIDASQPPQSSPWAPPGSVGRTIIDVDTSAEQTSVIPIARPVTDHRTEPAPEPARSTTAPREQAHGESMRGFFLGVVGLILIGVVFAIYIYAAWLSDSTRDTIDGWLPWVS